MTRFKSIAPAELTEAVVNMMAREWFLLTAGTPEKFNTMTCAWGGLGFLWNKPVCFVFVRPQRYTYEFTENHHHFTMSVLPEEYRSALQFCGTHSGRDCDKIAETDLTPVHDADGETTYFNEARLVLKCKKLYFDDIREQGFVDPDALGVYPEKDFHRLYIGQIEEVLIQS